MDKKFIARFPEMAEQIFNELNNEDLIKSKEVDKAWCDLIDQRLVWKRMIQSSTKHDNDFKFEFNLGLKKMPSDILKEFALVCFKAKWFNLGFSPLHIIAFCGDLLLYKYILEKSSDKNPKIRTEELGGAAPIHVAALYNNLEIVKFCIEHDENKNPKDCEGSTPLHHAAYKGDLEICKLIVLVVDDKNPRDKLGWTPLHAAARNGHSEIYKFIAERVDDKNPSDNQGNTPFEEAFDNGHLQICRIYLDILGIENPTLTEPEAKSRSKE